MTWPPKARNEEFHEALLWQKLKFKGEDSTRRTDYPLRIKGTCWKKLSEEAWKIELSLECGEDGAVYTKTKKYKNILVNRQH